jgi:threonyl-tRNA synthetase
MVCPITTEADSYGVTVLDALKAAGLRAGVDLRNEKINYKVREHSVSKIPVILAVGGREAEGQTVSMRRLGSKESQVLSLDEAVQILSDEATPPDLSA